VTRRTHRRWLHGATTPTERARWRASTGRRRAAHWPLAVILTIWFAPATTATYTRAISKHNWPVVSTKRSGLRRGWNDKRDNSPLLMYGMTRRRTGAVSVSIALLPIPIHALALPYAVLRYRLLCGTILAIPIRCRRFWHRLATRAADGRQMYLRRRARAPASREGIVIARWLGHALRLLGV
jgi:hypothetical protein